MLFVDESCFFFFKQKTAYEMRISDWSSDVCSSDLPNERIALGGENVLAVLNKMTWLDGSYEIKQGETKLGINVNTILTPFGTLKLMTHPLMNGNPVWRNEMYALHPGGITKRVLRERGCQYV